MRWAMAQAVAKSSAKFVLVAMADCVNGQGAQMVCWPTVAHLSDLTALDRKTVIEAMQRLRNAGLIRDTGDRKGATGQVIVYELKAPENGTVATPPAPVIQPAHDPEQGSANSTETGIDPETGTVPLFPANSPVFPHKESRFSPITVPKTGHGTSKEPGRNKEGTKKAFDAGSIVLPEWLDRAHWLRWVADRKQRNKRITEEAAKLQLGKLADYRAEGHEPKDVIEHSIASGYQGLFPPRRTAAPAKPITSSRHSGFRSIDYEEGLTNGIPDA